MGMKINQLRKERTVYPDKLDIFNIFRTTNPDEIKVVFVVSQIIDKHYCHPVCGCNSYFTSKVMKAWQNELVTEYPELENRFLVNGSLDWQDLTYLREQGLFFLNNHLTDDDKIGWKHEDIWKPFIENVIIALNKYQNLIFVFSGSSTWDLAKYVKIGAKIPHITSKEFQGCGILRRINYQLDKLGKKEIEW